MTTLYPEKTIMVGTESSVGDPNLLAQKLEQAEMDAITNEKTALEGLARRKAITEGKEVDEEVDSQESTRIVDESGADDRRSCSPDLRLTGLAAAWGVLLG